MTPEIGMGPELALASVMVLATVIFHGLGLSLLHQFLRVIRLRGGAATLRRDKLQLIIVTVLGLFVLHGSEIWLYAILYRLVGAIDSLRSAVYFSTITYGAIGYTDAPIAERWRLLGAIEGINGVLLLGWTTAFFVTNMNRMRRR